MDGEPRNGASERWRAEIPRWDDEQYVRTQARLQLAPDFVREDRRRLVAIPLGDADDYLEQFLSWFALGDGAPRFRVAEVVAVRGERLMLSRNSVAYTDGSGREALAIAQYSDGLEQCQRLITFDLDDLENAIAELDRLHAEIANDR